MSGYWICCNCDASLSCDACGVEQPDDSAYYVAIEAERNQLRADNDRMREALDHAVFEANSAIDGMKERDSKIERLTATLDQISREGECVYARRLAIAAITGHSEGAGQP